MNDETVMPNSTEYLPAPQKSIDPQAQQRKALWMIIGFGVLVLALIIGGGALLFTMEADQTSHIRDVFIIFMALEILVIGVAMIVLMVQLATLINLLQNEIKPILEDFKKYLSNKTTVE